jgi:hypothetical protein
MDANLVEKLDLKHSCFGKALLLEWRKTCCHARFTEYGKLEIFRHYRSLHRRSDFSSLRAGSIIWGRRGWEKLGGEDEDFSGETTVKKGVELLQDLVATETFNNLQKLSNMRRLTA